MAKKKRTTKAQREEMASRRDRRKNNLAAILLIVIALFLALGVYFSVPQLWWLSYAGKGLFGAGIFLLPVTLLYIAVSVIVPEKRVSLGLKIAAGVAVTLVVGMTQYLFCAKEYTAALDLGLLWQGSALLKCGGVVEGVIAVPLIMIISRWGLGIILAAVTLFSVLTITDRTLYDLWQGIKGLFGKLTPPEPVEPELVEDKPSRSRQTDIDVPVDTYEVADDGLDENGEPLSDLPVQDAKDVAFPEPQEPFRVEGLSVFTYPDVDPAHNIKPDELTPDEQQPAPVESEPFEMPEQENAPPYIFPEVDLLQKPKTAGGTTKEELEYNSQKLMETLRDFGVEGKMLGVSIGPNVTRYEFQPKSGTKVSKITALSDDIALSLAATQVRIEAPIPGKSAVGVEIPNQNTATVYIRDLIDHPDFKVAKSPLTVALGKDISGKNIYADLSKMPHLLIAGSTGSGKSVCINSILISLLYKSSPEDVKMILVDPKVVELGVYNQIPHLFIPVVTDPKKAAGALHWACSEMDRRYHLLDELNVRDIYHYNEEADRLQDGEHEHLPLILVVIDELADLMMVASKEVEEHICRLCQKARAAGIFLIIATQRPSTDVVTGLIKANVPSRIAFAVSSGIDSRVILDTVGAEKLLGRGDMLYKPIGANKPHRIQGCFVDDTEVEKVVDFIKRSTGEVQYDDEAVRKIEEMAAAGNGKGGAAVADGGDDDDELLNDAIGCVVEAGMASTSFIQRKLKVGYARAARMIDMMEEKGIVGPFEGAKPRSVKLTMSEWQEMKLRQGGEE